ncbi:MAG: transaldolase [Verrucomicrobia bacterium ADurb.Bin006]|nr:MAG: transaldolase [Verrucomicrobia bacterium ADurb.Bin006]HQK02436.1 transaldolase family protein [Verrucomicrobiota bacterium]
MNRGCVSFVSLAYDQSHGKRGRLMPHGGGDCEKVLAQFAAAGVNVDQLAKELQDNGAKAFVKSWQDMLGVIAAKGAALQQAA